MAVTTMCNAGNKLTIGIIDYACGNIQSIINALELLNYNYKLISTAELLSDVSIVILPGVGSFDHAVDNLHNSGLSDGILRWIHDDSNYLIGICLGMQLLCTKSEESHESMNGLNLISATVIDLNNIVKERVSIPHIGWNTVTISENDFILKKEYDFYFLHSYISINLHVQNY